jgi:hypothetical protein
MDKMKILNKEYLITTTLDSDDMLHKDYVKKIQKEFFKNQDLQIINFSTGYRIFVNQREVWKILWNCNSLFTMIEKIGNKKEIRTCRYVYSHVDICRRTFSKDVLNLETSGPMWLQIIHGANVQDKYREGERWENMLKSGVKVELNKEEIKELFGVEHIYSPQ